MDQRTEIQTPKLHPATSRCDKNNRFLARNNIIKHLRLKFDILFDIGALRFDISIEVETPVSDIKLCTPIYCSMKKFFKKTV